VKKDRILKIGVLALQGAFAEHINIFKRLSIIVHEVRLPAQLEGVGGLVVPGGESTTMMHLIESYGLAEPLKKLAAKNIPIWGVCAGMICLAGNVSNPDGSPMKTLGLMDISVKRNDFGRQVDSFETDLNIDVLTEGPFHSIFIRAPYIESAGKGVEILAKLADGRIVAARQKNLLVTSFHPELTGDVRLHSYFLDMVRS
jgi:5'-phosphate synthase pdxT subunit